MMFIEFDIICNDWKENIVSYGCGSYGDCTWESLFFIIENNNDKIPSEMLKPNADKHAFFM